MDTDTMIQTVEDAANSGEMPPSSLRVADRCDHKLCPSQAFVRVANETSAVMDWCGHHFAKLEASLMAAGFYISEDLRETLLLKSSDVAEARGA